ncbi:decaprenyl-phosphate phosphoribosyltransferase, partial [Streptacidiphilus monticola]
PQRARALLRLARRRQLPKNLLVFAAPLAAGSLGPHGRGAGGALVAFLAFTLSSTAVYAVNDVVDADQDRLHPRKRLRPVASGLVSEPQALVFAAGCVVLAEAFGAAPPGTGLSAAVTGYLGASALYCVALKDVPYVELVVVASGFVLRALGGAAAAEVPPSGPFVLVCSLGALLIVVAKRATESAGLGARARVHRPCLRGYSVRGLRAGQRTVGGVLLIAYVTWAVSDPDAWTGAWRLVSAVPLAAALVRFDALTGRDGGSAIEDLLLRDPLMLTAELLWLSLFVIGLQR